MNGRLAFVLGSARSGTTWLAKIIDSHPDVLYRHEPDIPADDIDLPLFCPPETGPFMAATTRAVDRYVDIRHVRSSGVRPIFPKSYRGPLGDSIRKGLIYVMRAVEGLPRIGTLAYRVPVADFVRSDPPLRLVKSVSSMGRVNLLADARPDARFIVIVRHPCGYVSSRLRQPGFEQAKGIGVGLPDAEQAQRRGLTLEAIESMSQLERLAWVWMIFNEKAMEDAEGRANCRVVAYESLCADPVAHARDIFEFLELDWHPQCEAFLSSSTTTDSTSSDYYSISRDTSSEIDKWKRELDADQIRTVEKIVADSCPGRLFFEQA